MTFCARANRYARQVVKGKIPAGKWTKLACQRQIDDLKRWRGKAAPYRFDRAAGNHICAFAECLPHIKGEWAKRGESIKLEDWQCFFLTTVFGWKRRDGLRRFRTAYLEVARKNAKSTIGAVIGLYMEVADGEIGAEVYSAATTRDQAKIIFETAREMARREPEIRSAYGLEVNAHNLHVVETGSKFEALSAEANSLDGLNVHCALVDELHAHKRRVVYDVLETAMGSRSQPLLVSVTTSGSDRAGICYEQRAYVIKLLERTTEDETYFGVIYTIDADDDWTDEAVWRKANPNLGVSVYVDDMRRLCAKAQTMASATNAFLTKRLDVWVNAATAWMDMRAWEACGDTSLNLEQFEGRRCFIGIDLASKIDIAAVSLLFPGDEGRYTLFGRYYLPEEAVESGRNSQYAGWVRGEKLIATEGAVNDLRATGPIGRDVVEFCSRFDVRAIAYDPWQMTQLEQDFTELGLPVVELRPNVANFSEPMKELEALVVSDKLRHDGGPVLTWMISNIVAKLDAKDNIYPRKDFVDNKIDGGVSAIMALGMAQRHQDSGPIDVSQLHFA